MAKRYGYQPGQPQIQLPTISIKVKAIKGGSVTLEFEGTQNDGDVTLVKGDIVDLHST